MSDDAQFNAAFETWLKRVQERPLPAHPIQRIRTMAKEVAEGAAQQFWAVYIYFFRGQVQDYDVQELLIRYLKERWNNEYPNFWLLMRNGYLEQGEAGSSEQLLLTPLAFALADEAEPTSIFISYKRSESSAFALLTLARLKAAGVEPFVDLALVPGEDWQAGLKARIGQYQYLIALLGKSTLDSDVCRQELMWAREAGLTIIPVWHNGFVYRSADWPGMPPELDKLLGGTHTIRVIEESALGYNNALVELLNRFGVTP